MALHPAGQVYYASQTSSAARPSMGQGSVISATRAVPYAGEGLAQDPRYLQTFDEYLQSHFGMSCAAWRRLAPSEKFARVQMAYPYDSSSQIARAVNALDRGCIRVPATAPYTFFHPSGQATDAAQGAAQGAVDHGALAPAPSMLSSVGFWRAATAATALAGVLAYHYKR